MTPRSRPTARDRNHEDDLPVDWPRLAVRVLAPPRPVRRIQLRLRPDEPPIRPPGGNRDRDAARKDRSLLLRRQLPGARPSAGPDRGDLRQDRLADGPDPPDVLPLRSEDGK